ncbi:expressed unknown protein [Seminavis robusta]|uniref:Uncharacterized protein n=1 Tax=Seminavis robusta TaxID=568900 RepID=A0A9N8HFK6_9STRA|nr:expressed unknown protein [Seminavis robusta]|eukprot:Sro439_g143250.1 n/a (365) ;mRNA; r:45084-46266
MTPKAPLKNEDNQGLGLAAPGHGEKRALKNESAQGSTPKQASDEDLHEIVVCNLESKECEVTDFQPRNATTGAAAFVAGNTYENTSMIDFSVMSLPVRQDALFPRESVPGAYAYQAFPRSYMYEPQPPSEQTNMAESNVDPAENGARTGTSDALLEEGLVTARPVSTPIMAQEKAQPVVFPTETHSNQDEKIRKNSAFAVACIVSLALLGAVIAVCVSISSDETVTLEDTKITNGSSIEPNGSTSKALQLDLPIQLPNSTLHVFENDINGSSPQYKAYRWVQQDPWIGNYSSARILQRFVLATMYFATGNNETKSGWFHIGGGTTTLQYLNTSLEDTIAFYSKPWALSTMSKSAIPTAHWKFYL